jgi:hypothetical protein
VRANAKNDAPPPKPVPPPVQVPEEHMMHTMGVMVMQRDEDVEQLQQRHDRIERELQSMKK